MDTPVEVVRIRNALVVGRPDVDHEAVALAESLPEETGHTTAVVGASALAAVMELDPWVVADIAGSVTGGLRLVAPSLPATAQGGALLPGQLLSEWLGVEVAVADGAPRVLPNGSLFASGSGWVTFHSGRPGVRNGPRLPAPSWQHELPVPLPPGTTQIPLGLWVRNPSSELRPDDALHACVTDPDRMYVVVGAPGEPSPSPVAVADALRALPGEARARAVLAPYGGSGQAGAVADELGMPVRAAHGVPLDGRPVLLDDAGQRLWRPFAVESVYVPGYGPVLDRWVAPTPTLALAEPGSYRLADGWRVDVVASGLLVRPESVAPRLDWLTEPRPNAQLVLAAESEIPASVVSAVDDLVRGLPSDARETIRVIPVTESAAHALGHIQSVAGADRGEVTQPSAAAIPLTQEPPQQEPQRDESPMVGVAVTIDGRVLPAEPIVPERARDFRQTMGPGVIGAPNESAEPDRVGQKGTPERRDRLPMVAGTVRPRLVGSLESASDEPPLPRQTSPSVPVPPGKPVPPTPTTGRSVTTVDLPAEGEPLSRRPSRPPPADSPQSLPTLVATSERSVPVETLEETGPAAPESDAEPSPPQGSAEQAAPLRRPAEGGREESPVEVPADARSTPEQRKKVREKLGSTYDAAIRAITTLLSERPGLRAGRGEEAALLAELAVVRVFGTEPVASYDADFHVCLASGLRRLPTVRAVVVRGIPEGTAMAPESVVRLREPVVAAPADTPNGVGEAEALIWATTARRLDGLVPPVGSDGAEVSGDVVLPGHTRLKVLGVEGGPIRRILLAEDGSDGDDALTRLRAAAKARADVELSGPASNRWYGPLPAA